MAKKLGQGRGMGAGASVPYANPHPDPLAGVEYTDPPNLEADSAAELSALDQAFRQRRDAEERRYKHAVDASYWVGVCFHSYEDLEEFLTAIGLNRAVFRGQYLDGYQLARAIGAGPIGKRE